MADNARGIVVGVTGPGENTSALRWAAAEAAARDAPVTLVHAVHEVLPPPAPSVLMASEPMIEVGRTVLDGVVEEYSRLSGGAEALAAVEEGPPARVLTDRSQDAELVVLAHRHLSGVKRIVTFSTAVHVAAHARCPVVAVPVDWSPGAPSTWVTAGVHETGAAPEVLTAALQAASVHGLKLRLVHAWRTEPQYDDIIVRRVASDWESQVEGEMRSSVAPWSADYPDVEIDCVVRRDWPADALAELASSSALLVVGRHGHQPPMPDRIGSIARTALRTSACPTMVVPV